MSAALVYGNGDLDCKSLMYRQLTREIYAESCAEGKKLGKKGTGKYLKRDNNVNVVGENKWRKFIQYVCTEHEYKMSFIIFLPLMLTSLYIMFIEDSSLYTVGTV